MSAREKLIEENKAKYEKLSTTLAGSIDIMNSAKEITSDAIILDEAIQILAKHDALTTIWENKLYERFLHSKRGWMEN